VPGSWWLTVRSREWPRFVGVPFELAAEATRDVGTITLALGGRARIEIGGDRQRAARARRLRAGRLRWERFRNDRVHRRCAAGSVVRLELEK